jgi:hypothetical protein
MDAAECAVDCKTGSDSPKVCACPCHKDFPNCEHESIGHNDGPDCAVCELGEEIEQLKERLARERQRHLSDQEIDEAVAQLMEHAGCARKDSGWEWRELRDYSKEVEAIVRQLLAGEFDESV